jgi:2'-5' RNA ligase
VRLFFALWPDDGVRARLAGWSKELHAACGGRAISTENLHLTVAFLGNVEDAHVAEVVRAAAGVEPRAARLDLDRPGFWSHNRIAWAGASEVPAELDAFVQELRVALRRSSVDFDAKAFAVHITLLRDARAPQTMPELEPIRWDVDGFVLVRSQTQAGGSRYQVLKSWKAPGRLR